MGWRWNRDRVLVVAGLVLVTGASMVLAWVYLLPLDERNNAVGFWGFALAVAVAVITLWGWLGKARRPAEPRPVDTLSSLLAQGVHEQWRKAAVERVLLAPDPIPLRWSLSNLEVAGPVTAAVGAPDVPPAFSPLPGQTTITQDQLQAGGGRRELFAAYAGIGSGRVVVIGAPGAGKSGSAILLLLDALEQRERLDDTERARVPVPVLFTAHGWDPNTSSVHDLLCARLAGTYPLFQHRGGHAEAAALVGARDKVTLILDGLDEMDEALRPAALKALSDAPFRVVVLSRSHEMAQATRSAWLVGAVAIHLHDVTAGQAADYLQRAPTGPLPSGWSQLLTHLRGQPDSVLARGLSTPLALTLIRDTYRVGDDVGELLDASRYLSPEHIEQHLVARVLPDAYAVRPGRPPPRYNLTQATQALAFIARRMNQHHTRDFAWWHIPLWAPATPRIVGSMLVGGLLGGLAYGLGVGLPLMAFGAGFVDGLLGGPGSFLAGPVSGVGLGIIFGLAAGRGGGEPKRVRNWRAVNFRPVLLAGLACGLASGIAAWLIMQRLGTLYRLAFEGKPPDMVWGLAFSLVLGLPLVLTRVFAGDPVEGEGSLPRVLKSWRNDGAVGLVAGLMVGLVEGHNFWPGGIMFGLMFGIVFGLLGGLVFGLGYGLMRRFGARFVGRLVVGLAEGEDRPLGPLESWRSDRVFGVVIGLTFGLFAVGVGIGIFVGLTHLAKGLLGLATTIGLGPALTAGLGFALVVGLVYGITFSATWPTTVAWLQLQRSRCVPTVRLMAFLEDARDRGVLRTVGASYQFRHATLQDHLADPVTPNPVTFSAVRSQAAEAEARRTEARG